MWDNTVEHQIYKPHDCEYIRTRCPPMPFVRKTNPEGSQTPTDTASSLLAVQVSSSSLCKTSSSQKNRHITSSLSGDRAEWVSQPCCLALSMKPTQPNSNNLGSQLQAHHIGATTNTPGSDPGKLPKNLAKPDQLKVFKYRSPGSVSAIKIDFC